MNVRSFLAAAAVAVLAGFGTAQAANMDVCQQSQNWDARVKACTALIETGDYKGVMLATLYSSRGHAYNKKKYYHLALPDLDSATRHDPANGLHFHRRAVSLMELNRSGEALEDVERALERGHETDGVYLSRAVALSRLGRTDAAMKAYEVSMKKEPKLADSFYWRGWELARLGRDQEALADFSKAITLNPTHRKALINRAGAACRAGEPEITVKDNVDLISRGVIRATVAQSYLKRAGYYKGPIDGAFGPGSRGALRAWAEAGCP
ncbi:MAG: hypothetical protein TEF_01275 [Rhizobiales bacterium NRL2]|mgnify:CR=1 FL=1|jgi:tetratricopeptide (TPR) repeat protein|nr:MAG: hypothetical protein TEF_01275 [Rhizobiales bacterium NRL2]